MQEMLAAIHFARYLETRRKEQEPQREVIPENRFSVVMRLFRNRRGRKAC